MKVLLDECLPRRLLRDLPEHAVTTVPRQGWQGLDDGALLPVAQGSFDVFVTMDTNLVYQQNLAGSSLCIVVLHAASNRYEDLTPLIEDLRETLRTAHPGQIIHLSQPPKTEH
jgi:predicted nuclease of predicted toxin-antitoxin system